MSSKGAGRQVSSLLPGFCLDEKLMVAETDSGGSDRGWGGGEGGRAWRENKNPSPWGCVWKEDTQLRFGHCACAPVSTFLLSKEKRC